MSNKLAIKDKRFYEVEERINKMKARAEEFCQSRSNFQIEKFIAGDEYTNISKFRHVAHNSYTTAQEIRRCLIEQEKLKRELDSLNKNLREDGPENPLFGFYTTDLEIYDLERKLEALELRIKGLSKEVDYMEAICDKLEADEIARTGTGFTAEKYEADQPEYWRRRLTNQMHMAQIGNGSGVGEGNYKSLLSAVETPILNDANMIPAIPVDVNVVAAQALVTREGLKDKYLSIEEPQEEQLITE